MQVTSGSSLSLSSVSTGAGKGHKIAQYPDFVDAPRRSISSNTASRATQLPWMSAKRAIRM
jgi:hypothetical protein